MKYFIRAIMLVLILGTISSTVANAQKSQKDSLQQFSKLLSASVTKHLDLLLDNNGKLSPLKGKATDASTALAFYRMYEMYGNKKYRDVAITLADEILAEMKQEKFGVLFIKDKENNSGKKIAGGGPPALAFYTANLAYIYYNEGNRDADILYIANVLNNFPYNDKGWWANSIDIKTGEAKNGLSKPSPVNKSAAMAMAAGMVSGFIKNTNPALSNQLKTKADQCIYNQIIPAQEPDGFWHYGLTNNDPKDKDVLGYFMLTTEVLMQLYHSNPNYSNEKLKTALTSATAFAYKTIAPITHPNIGMLANQYTIGTPTQYKITEEIKRGYAVGAILLEGGYINEAIKIVNAWSVKFPYGNAGSDGAHALNYAVLMLGIIENKSSAKPK
jgi:hypothetical protein